MSVGGHCIGAGGRGCSCDYHVRQRAYQRQYAAARRAERFAELNRSSRTCRKGRGGFGVCGALLEERMDSLGRVETYCPACERVARGICLDCPARVAGQIGKSIRCARHAAEARREYQRRCDIRHKDEQARRDKQRRDKQRRDRMRREQDPRYLAKLEYKRAWRKANRDKVRAQKQRAAARSKGRVSAYMAAYREKHRDHYRELQQRKDRQRQAERPEPTCRHPGCGAVIRWDWRPRSGRIRPPSRCDAHAWPHERRQREQLRAALVEQARAEMESGVPGRRRIRRPPGYQRPVAGHRVCPTPGCSTVLAGRKKKCTKCKSRDAELARQALAARAGRGRRLDLEGVA